MKLNIISTEQQKATLTKASSTCAWKLIAHCVLWSIHYTTKRNPFWVTQVIFIEHKMAKRSARLLFIQRNGQPASLGVSSTKIHYYVWYISGTPVLFILETSLKPPPRNSRDQPANLIRCKNSSAPSAPSAPSSPNSDPRVPAAADVITPKPIAILTAIRFLFQLDPGSTAAIESFNLLPAKLWV